MKLMRAHAGRHSAYMACALDTKVTELNADASEDQIFTMEYTAVSKITGVTTKDRFID